MASGLPLIPVLSFSSTLIPLSRIGNILSRPGHAAPFGFTDAKFSHRRLTPRFEVHFFQILPLAERNLQEKPLCGRSF